MSSIHGRGLRKKDYSLEPGDRLGGLAGASSLPLGLCQSACWLVETSG
ncbi:hypothetical protein [Ktedonospora formicarum]|nr:hypothetical protein [Ktedonospora formicarum]